VCVARVHTTPPKNQHPHQTTNLAKGGC
jgi:hypothetical protein